jgi:hypothetical protein
LGHWHVKVLLSYEQTALAYSCSKWFHLVNLMEKQWNPKQCIENKCQTLL